MNQALTIFSVVFWCFSITLYFLKQRVTVHNEYQSANDQYGVKTVTLFQKRNDYPCNCTDENCKLTIFESYSIHIRLPFLAITRLNAKMLGLF